MKILNKITDIITKVLTVAACVYLVYILFACIMQVFSRYVLNSSFGWTEETARHAFACMGMLGAPVALRKGMHVRVDILETMLSGKLKLALKIVIALLVFFIYIILFREGFVLFESAKGLYSPAVRVPMTAVYYSIPVSALASMWMLAVELIETAAGWRERRT